MKECKTSSQRVVNVFFWNQHFASTGQAMYFSNFTLSSTPWDSQYSKANLLCICNRVQHLESLQSWWSSICTRASNHGHHQGSLQRDLGSEYFSNCLRLLLHKVNEAGSEFPKSCQNWFDPQIRILFVQTSSRRLSQPEQKCILYPATFCRGEQENVWEAPIEPNTHTSPAQVCQESEKHRRPNASRTHPRRSRASRCGSVLRGLLKDAKDQRSCSPNSKNNWNQ